MHVLEKPAQMPPATLSSRTPPLVDADLCRLVNAFYELIRADPVLGPIFERQVDDWDEHTERLVDFWSSVMLGSGRYKGNPFGAHLPFRDSIDPSHFERWLNLWGVTARQMFDPPIAAMLEAKASRIAESLRAGLLFGPDTLAARSDTFPLTS